MAHPRYYLDWLFKDLQGRNGKYVIAEAPNLPLIVFMVTIVLALIMYRGFFQTFFAACAYLSFAYWGYFEARSGRSRFRKILGYLALLSVTAALAMGLGY